MLPSWSARQKIRDLPVGGTHTKRAFTLQWCTEIFSRRKLITIFTYATHLAVFWCLLTMETQGKCFIAPFPSLSSSASSEITRTILKISSFQLIAMKIALVRNYADRYACRIQLVIYSPMFTMLFSSSYHAVTDRPELNSDQFIWH